MRFSAGFSWSVVYYFFFWGFVEGLSGYHEFNYSFAEVSVLNHYVPKELIDVPSPNYHYCF